MLTLKRYTLEGIVPSIFADTISTDAKWSVKSFPIQQAPTMSDHKYSPGQQVFYNDPEKSW
eukprot:gene12333-3627_t